MNATLQTFAASGTASSVTDTVLSGPFLLAAALALAAGVVSFASPCVLPLVPGYLSYLVGLVGAEESAAGGGRGAGRGVGTAVRSRAVRATGLFVIGFTVVFVAESQIVLGFSRFLAGNQLLLTRIGGVVTVIVGLAMLGWVRPMQREARIHARPTGRISGAPLLGAFFALGWTVCIGPTFLGINSLVIASDWNSYAWRGLFLILLYCIGLGVPFLVLAFGFGWATSAFGFLRRHSRTIQIVGALALIAIGLLMVTGVWTDFVAWLQNRYILGVEPVL
ncbi:cytochrome c biogenesis CcdA family protein [Nakamurella lactea]|uniref:cytochrome c biogenesis CcdA family protein n=1 Tax=Nakamurella lactea TaxID=459515 RepID=UPI0003F8854A|nr:cytochrome c biogenesis CcdA family protein [Nakamurella lactea]